MLLLLLVHLKLFGNATACGTARLLWCYSRIIAVWRAEIPAGKVGASQLASC